MNSNNLYKKILTSLMAFCALNSWAMQDPWAYFAAASNGHQIPLNFSSPKPRIAVKWDWHKKCANLTKDELLYELDQFFKVENSGLLNNPANWVNEKLPSQQFFNDEKVFEPYVMKLEVNPNTEIAFHGDIHGDKDSLIAYLTWLAENGYTDPEDPFRIIKDNFYILFLGDYTDRGKDGAEVIFTISRLKRTNPTKVFMVRGNHEDTYLNAYYGFKKELEQKFKDDGQILKTISRMYNYLPVAMYLVCNNGDGTKDALLCCHGGIEVGFDIERCHALLSTDDQIKYTLLGSLYRKTNCKKLPEKEKNKSIQAISDAIDFTPTEPIKLHFLWNDFDVINFRTRENPHRAWLCDKEFTDFVNNLQSTTGCTIRGVFRGHQHGDNQMMRRILNRDNKNYDADIGVGKLWIEANIKPDPEILWDGIVCTFSVCPNTGYGTEHKFNFDAFGILKTANQYTGWRLKMHRITPIIT